MKILIIANFRQGVGGISGQVEALQRHLQEEGFLVDIYSTKGRFWKRLIMPFKLNKIIREYDVIHIHCCSDLGFLPAILGIWPAKKYKKRTILTYHGGGAEQFFSKHLRIVKFFLLRTDYNIVLSDFLGNVFKQYNIPYIIIPNIIELDDSLYCKRSKLNPSFICTRSHEMNYNIPCILKAFRIVQEQVPDAKLTLLGDGSLHEELMRQSSEIGLNNVIFTGRVDNNVIYDYLNHADIMVSSPKVDNMPVSLLEAMNAGLLVISSDVGGVPFMIKDMETGLLFPSNDHKALAQKMLWSLEHQTCALSIIESAHEEVKNYNWTSIRSKILSSYCV